jgi:hypothetical protein
MASTLKQAIQAVADHTFLEMPVSAEWKDAKALVWSSICELDQPGERFPIHFLLYRDSGKWVIDEHQLEAALGLWLWSLKSKCPQGIFERRVLGVVENDKAENLKSTIRLWVSQTLHIDEDPALPRADLSPSSLPSSGLPNPWPPRLTALPLVLSSVTAVPEQPAVDVTSESRVMLSTPTVASPAKLVTQDIFTLFMNRIVEVLEPLKTAGHRIRRPQDEFVSLDAKIDSSFLGLTEPNLEILAGKFTASGLGSMEDGLTSIT